MVSKASAYLPVSSAFFLKTEKVDTFKKKLDFSKSYATVKARKATTGFSEQKKDTAMTLLNFDISVGSCLLFGLAAGGPVGGVMGTLVGLGCFLTLGLRR